MSGRPLVIGGNWKMHLDREGAARLASEMAAGWHPDPQILLILFPPYPYLEAVGEAIAGSPLMLGAQLCHPEDKGAYTGAVAARMCRDMGCGAVLAGHSERRSLFREGDQEVGQQVQAILAHGMRPVLCLGETLDQRDAGEVEAVLRRQLVAALDGLQADQLQDLILAYEPVWAIGTGRTATPDQAEEAHAFLRDLLASRFDRTLADRIPIMYGGSVKPHNAADILDQPNIDGALVGGASLKAESFLAIARAGGPSELPTPFP